MRTGYIKVYRGVLDHWIYKDPAKFRAWVTIMMLCRFKPGTVIRGLQAFHCDRGEAIYSLSEWNNYLQLGGKTNVRRFFDRLESDEMIVTENLGKSTRVRVMNYPKYQGEETEWNDNGTNSVRATRNNPTGYAERRNDNGTITERERNDSPENPERHGGTNSVRATPDIPMDSGSASYVAGTRERNDSPENPERISNKNDSKKNEIPKGGPLLYKLALKKGQKTEVYEITEEEVLWWSERYPKADVDSEFRKMEAWTAANPAKRKTLTGTPRFINTWLSGKTKSTRDQLDIEQFLEENL